MPSNNKTIISFTEREDKVRSAVRTFCLSEKYGGQKLDDISEINQRFEQNVIR